MTRGNDLGGQGIADGRFPVRGRTGHVEDPLDGLLDVEVLCPLVVGRRHEVEDMVSHAFEPHVGLIGLAAVGQAGKGHGFELTEQVLLLSPMHLAKGDRGMDLSTMST